jgi:hypothetical protein
MYRLRSVSLYALALPLALAAAPAAEGYVKIMAPADGARLGRMTATILVYEVSPGPRGSHVHVYVDGREVGILRAFKGSYALKALSPGERTVCVKVVSHAHVPIGIEQCIRVRVE